MFKNKERLNYVECAADGKGAPKWAAGNICKNCRFFQPDKFEGSCAGCMLFVNGGVEPGGYCKSWAAQEA